MIDEKEFEMEIKKLVEKHNKIVEMEKQMSNQKNQITHNISRLQGKLELLKEMNDSVEVEDVLETSK